MSYQEISRKYGEAIRDALVGMQDELNEELAKNPVKGLSISFNVEAQCRTSFNQDTREYQVDKVVFTQIEPRVSVDY